LRAAGLVHVRVDGNCRLYRVDFDLLADVRAQLARAAGWADTSLRNNDWRMVHQSLRRDHTG
jgi:hypothetical protein